MSNREDSKSRLRAVDDRSLRRFMRLHGFDVTASTRSEEIIETISKRKDVENLLEPPTRLELKSLDSGLEQKLVNQLDNKLGILDERIKLVDEKIKATEHPGKLIDEKLKWIESFTKGLSAATAILGIVGLSGGVFTLWKLAELSQRSTEIQSTLDRSAVVIGHNLQLMIDTNLDEMAEFMDRFSLSNPDVSLLSRVERRLGLLRQAHKTTLSFTVPGKTDTSTKNVDALILKIIIMTYESVQALRPLAPTRDTRLQSANEAEVKAINLGDLLESETDVLTKHYPEEMRRLKAYRENLLGIIYYRKYRLLEEKNNYLELARKQFELAIQRVASFFPAYNNLAVVLFHDYGAIFRKLEAGPISVSEKDQLSKVIRAANTTLEKAREYAKGPKQSNILNSIAYYSLVEAELLERTGDIAAALTKLNEARVTIDKVFGEDPVAPAAYSTGAEILCYEWHLSQRAKGEMSLRLKDEISSKLRSLLHTGAKRGYIWEVGSNKAKFFLYEGRFINHCRNLFATDRTFDELIVATDDRRP